MNEYSYRVLCQSDCSRQGDASYLLLYSDESAVGTGTARRREEELQLQ